MSNIQIFNNPDFGTVRTLDNDGTVLFCGADIAKALDTATRARHSTTTARVT